MMDPKYIKLIFQLLKSLSSEVKAIAKGKKKANLNKNNEEDE